MNNDLSQMPIIQIEGADLGYRTDAEPALKDITISFYPGDMVAVIGPNGAGKSTMMKSIVGLIPPLKGEINVHGKLHGAHPDCVSYIPQRESIDWNYPITVREVVMMGRYGKIPFYKNPSEKDRKTVEDALKRMEITALADRKIRDCSGGQQQRVFLARSLAQEPHILLMDEPFNAVDLATEKIILDNLRVFKERHVTTLVATHDLSLVSENFEKVLLLNKRIIAYGNREEVLTDKKLQLAYGKKAIYF
ncbi:MAG TPA: metal ABC transporter ATP-binding protein [Flexilinea sp.]|nr:metal ABC transporter ATP-binding protein [Flexilinea sp.]